MKTSQLFTALLATALFAAAAQAHEKAATTSPGESRQASGTAQSAESSQSGKSAQTGSTAPASRSASAKGALSASGQGSADTGAAANAIAQRYADAAGSVGKARAIVDDLRSGAEGQAMSLGDVDTTLALASNLVADGDAANLDAAVDTVVDLHNDGLGWQQVAQKLGTDLGSTVSAAHAAGAQAAQGVRDTASSAVSSVASSALSATPRVGVNATTGQGSANVDASASGQVAKPQLDNPAADVHAAGNLGIDARPSLPLVRPLLSH